MDVLYPAVYIEKPYFSGKLLIDGDIKDNCIFFRFLFDKDECIHPLLIWVKIIPIISLKISSEVQSKSNEKIYIFECNISDSSNPIMKTHLIFPDFSLKDNKIEVINIESQVSYKFCLSSSC